MSTAGTRPQWIVPLSDTTLGEQEARAAADVVRSGWLTQGERVAAFERAFAESLGVTHAIAVANCTLGLELAYHAAGVGPGDEVIIPALTFVAGANAARRLGAKPVFADVRSSDDLCIDPEDVTRKLTAKTRAICLVHYAGYLADTDVLAPVAARAGISLIEDCAHAPGASRRGRSCGALGDIGTFSFFSNKNLTTGEGGMVTASRADLAAKIRALRAHGMTSTTWDRHHGHSYSYDVEVVGTNARFDEVRAAIGLIQLQKLERSNAMRAGHVARYRARLADVPGLTLPFSRRSPEERAAYHLFVVLLPDHCDRTGVMSALRARGIQSSIHYPPIHRFRAYEDGRTHLPVTDGITARLLTLPLYPSMTESQVDYVCDALIFALS